MTTAAPKEALSHLAEAAPPPAPAGRRASSRRPSRTVDPAPWVVALLTLVSRLAVAAHGPTDWDSAQFLAGASHYDVAHGRPQPPGYWLYVEGGRLLHALGLSSVTSLVLLAALASAAGAGLAVVAGRELGGRVAGIAAGLLVATSPFAWFSGAVVATYSFSMLAGVLLLVLAWRARPGSWHGVGAVVTLGVAAGFRQSGAVAFCLLVLIAVAGSTRTWRRLAVTAGAGAAAVGAWFVPMVLAQPGGFAVWWHATLTESRGAAQATSLLDGAPAGWQNVGSFAAYTVVALFPLAVVACLALVALGLRRLARPPSPRPAVPHDADRSEERPWYQSRTAVLAAALVPPMGIVALVQFAKGGYLLAYLPAAVIALVLPLESLARSRAAGPRHGDRARRRYAPGWLAAVAAGVAGLCVLGGARFLGAPAVLPQSLGRNLPGLWLTQPRYGASYGNTRAVIRGADAMDAGFATLGSHLRPARDVVVLDSLDAGGPLFRNAGWALPRARLALVGPQMHIYNEEGGTLYYDPGRAIKVGPGGVVLLVCSPTLPGLAGLLAHGHAAPLAAGSLGPLRVYRVSPGAAILAVPVVATAGPRPLGGPI